jgi:hypothetical protein
MCYEQIHSLLFYLDLSHSKELLPVNITYNSLIPLKLLSLNLTYKKFWYFKFQFSYTFFVTGDVASNASNMGSLCNLQSQAGLLRQDEVTPLVGCPRLFIRYIYINRTHLWSFSSVRNSRMHSVWVQLTYLSSVWFSHNNGNFNVNPTTRSPHS